MTRNAGMWCTLGGQYLQYLHAYDPNDGQIQLENFSKFFSYTSPLTPLPTSLLFLRRDCWVYVDLVRIRRCTSAPKDPG
jgi:hypothetical protein